MRINTFRRTRRLGMAAALALSGLLVLAGCSGAAGSAGAGGREITVWVMDGDYTMDTINAINAEFSKQTGATARVERQSWDGITTKLTTALSTAAPPDVLDLGNTQVASLGASGGLLDLTDDREEFAQGQTWLEGLEAPATIDGRLYAVPGFAGARAVIYNKTVWAEAGVTEPPTTFAEFTAALDTVRSVSNAPDFSPIYLPGQYWYVGLQFVWDAGGSIASSEGGRWTGNLESPASLQGLQNFKNFQNTYSTPASRTLDTDRPEQQQVLADGKTTAIVATNVYLGKVLDANPDLEESDLGTFPLPGADGPQPVLLGGSDWGIAAKTRNAELAKAWVKIAASPKIQQDWVFATDGWIPNSVEATEAARATVPEVQRAFFTAALNSKAPPASEYWVDMESTRAVNDLFSQVASGSRTVPQAAATFDARIAETLNQNTF